MDQSRVLSTTRYRPRRAKSDHPNPAEIRAMTKGRAEHLLRIAQCRMYQARKSATPGRTILPIAQETRIEPRAFLRQNSQAPRAPSEARARWCRSAPNHDETPSTYSRFRRADSVSLLCKDQSPIS